MYKRQKLPKDAVRNTLGRLLGNLYDTGERDRFRTRVERTAGGSEIYVSHRGAEEVFVGLTREATTWRARPNDPELEAEVLARMLVTLGAKDELALARHDLPAMRAHFDRAGELATASGGPASLELAIVLLGYGQLLASVDLDQGLPMLEKAIGLLDQLRSPRAIAARAALAIALSYHGRTAEAVPLLEQAVRDAPAATEPYNLALMRWSLAKALVATKGDRARARALAIAARDQLRPLGAPALVDEIDAWLRRRR